MNKMKNYYTGILGVLMLCGVLSCNEASKEMFEGPYSAFFQLKDLKSDTTLILRNDTVVYTFAYEPDEVRTREICIPVMITGSGAEKGLSYRVEVTTSKNTTANTDFEPIATEWHIPAGKMTDSLRIILKRNPSMQTATKEIRIRLVEGGDLIQGVKEKLFVAVRVSDVLEMPGWWEHWEIGFGDWHPTKLREWIKIWGGKGDLPTDKRVMWYYAPKECMAIVKLKEVFDKDPGFFDEEGHRLLIPASF